MKMQLDLNGPSPPLIIHGLKTLIEDGDVETLEITGDGLSNATAIGKLLNIDPSILASSQDVPLVIDLDTGTRRMPPSAVYGSLITSDCWTGWT